MPALLEDPRSTVLDVPISTATATTIAQVARLLAVTSIDFSVRVVLKNVHECLDSALVAMPAARPFMTTAVQDLDRALDELDRNELPTPGVKPGFLPSDQQALRLLTRFPPHSPEGLKQTVGNLMAKSWLTDLPLPRSRCVSLNALCHSVTTQPCLTQEQESKLDALLQHSQTDLNEVVAQHLQTQDKSVLRFNSQVTNHFRSNLTSAHPALQRDAALIRVLDGPRLKDAIGSEVASMEAGDSHALGTLLGFSLNLYSKLLEEVPIHIGEQGQGHLFWIDPLAGVTHLDLRPLLRDLGRPVPGCQLSRDTLRLSLPSIVAKHLRIAALQQPTARRIGDLVAEPEAKADAMVDAREKADRTKLMRSAPSAAIRLSGNRAVSAYSFLAFNLLDASDLPYISVSEEHIWQVRAEVFKSVGLGTAVPIDRLEAGHVGSARSASDKTVQAVFQEMDAAVTEVPVGRRYTLDRLVEHHNRYCIRVAMFLQLVAGARHSQEVGFLASSWFSGSLFGYLDDKKVGVSGGHTPIPISPSTHVQLGLWFLHLKSLQGRLTKQLGHRAKDAAMQINSILNTEVVSLFFLLDRNGRPQALTLDQLFVGCAANLNGDWGRHVLASKLTSENSPLADVHMLLRHQGGGINPQAAFNVDVQMDRLQRTALTIDLILQELNIQPLAGLAGRDK